MEPKGLKFIISTDLTFHETRMRRKQKHLKVKDSKTMMDKDQFEVEALTSVTR